MCADLPRTIPFAPCVSGGSLRSCLETMHLPPPCFRHARRPIAAGAKRAGFLQFSAVMERSNDATSAPQGDPVSQTALGRRALLLINPNSRLGAAHRDEVAAELRARGLEVEVPSSDVCGAVEDVIREHRAHVDMILIGGGDGSLNHAANVLVRTGLPVGIVPLGTANDLARTLGIPTTIAGACDVIAQGERIPIDLGWINGRYFFNAANIGAGVTLTKQLSKERKGRWGALSYALTAVKALRESRPFEAEIVHGDTVHHVRSMHITVGNGRHQGGMVTIAEDAAIDDGWLDLYSMQPMPIWQCLALVPSLRRGTQSELDAVHMLRNHEFTIRTSRPMDVAIDGEIALKTPIEVRVMRHALTIIAPRPREGMSPEDKHAA